MKSPPYNKATRLTAEALSDLNAFHAIIAICEGGCFHAPSFGATERIIRICKSEAGKRLNDYDRHMAACVRDAADSIDTERPR